MEQRAFASFREIPFHHRGVFSTANDNANEFYTYAGPDSTIALKTFRVDSPMKGNFSATDETKLSFQLISIDTQKMTMTVRECLWNTVPGATSNPIQFGQTCTIALETTSGSGYMKGDFHQHTTYTDGSKFLQDHDVHEQQVRPGLVGETAEHGGRIRPTASAPS